MKQEKTSSHTGKYVRRLVLGCLLALVLAIRFVPHGGEIYATILYPPLSFGLSLLSSFIPWSLEELVVLGFVVALVFYPIYALLRKVKIGWTELEILLWLVVWFYLGWGCNYFRASFYDRLMISRTEYSQKDFHAFLQDFTDSLNASYLPEPTLDREAVRREIRQLFRAVPKGYGLTRPRSFQEPKSLLLMPLYSRVGVLGFMGPFFSESQLNPDLSDLEYPFTYAHELSHLLGVSEEAEANYWAYYICTQSADPAVRYSAYNGLLTYVWNNAKTAMSDIEFQTWKQTVRQEVLDDENRLSLQWKERRNSTLNHIQDQFYNLFLKSNRIENGMQNYSQVIAMLMAVRESQKEPIGREGRGLSINQ